MNPRQWRLSSGALHASHQRDMEAVQISLFHGERLVGQQAVSIGEALEASFEQLLERLNPPADANASGCEVRRRNALLPPSRHASCCRAARH